MNGLALSGAALTSGSLDSVFAKGESSGGNSRIVISRDTGLRPSESSLDAERLHKLLDRAVQALFDRDDPVSAWRCVVKPGEVVGLKVNCLAGRWMSTTPELVEAVCERLQQAGIKGQDIIVWDRLNTDLEDAGFPIRYKGPGIRYIGNDVLGYEPELMVYGAAGSLVCRTLTRVCDAVINMPVLKDHGIAGLPGALKNMFGAIHNPNKYHLDNGDPYVADVYSLSPIRSKTRLAICDATTAQYEGGPSFMPHWTWPFNGLLVGTDPVALDHTAWHIIERKRAEMNMSSLKAIKREPTYIATAASAQHNLGTDDPSLIDVIEV